MARDEHGQSLVEVALTLPLLLLIVLGIVDVGRVYAYKSAATNAAREAAIYAARDPRATQDEICRRAREELGAGAAPSNCATAPIAIRCTRAGLDCGNDASDLRLYQADAGSAATVTVQLDVQLLTGYLVGRAFKVNPVVVGATAVFAGLSQ